MCRFTGSRHRDYSPSRSARTSYWRRLPTIYEATDVEMAKENESNERKKVKELERNEMETEQVVGENVFSLSLKTKSKSARKNAEFFWESLTSSRQMQHNFSIFKRSGATS